jgi:hypothetical protein
MLSVLGVHCVNVVQTAICIVFLGLVHMLCPVPHHCAMCVQLVKCAMLSMLGVHCANSVRIAVCKAFLGQVALCTCCVQCPITVQCVCSL